MYDAASMKNSSPPDTRPLFAGYPRVSFMGTRKADADDFHSVRDQVRPMRQEAELLGVRLEVVEPDLNAKGQDPEREALVRIWEGVESGKYQGVLVAYLSRLTRTTRHALELWERTIAAGGRVIAIREGIDSANMTPHSWFQLKVLSGVDELQVDLARESFDAQRAAAVAAGVWAFRQTPSGYDKDKGTRKLVPNQRRELRNADGVRWAFRSVPFTPVRVIAERLQMTSSGVRQMLRNRVYLGELHVGGKLQTRGKLKGTISQKYENLNAHEPLVGEDEFAAAQHALAASTRPPRSRKQRHAALLAGLVVCSGCGHMMSRSDTYRAITYACHGHSSGGRCPAVAAITMHLLDDYVEAIVLDHLRLLRANARRHDRDLEATRAELRAARKELASYLAMVDAAGLGVDVAADGARRRQEQVRAAEAAHAAMLARVPLAISDDPVEAWKAMDVTQRNRLSRSLIEAVIVERSGGRGVIRPVKDRARVIAHGAGIVSGYAGGGRPHGIRPIPLADLNGPVVLGL
jgi:DNA invertase Pin-like site-specific DNA recombinase